MPNSSRRNALRIIVISDVRVEREGIAHILRRSSRGHFAVTAEPTNAAGRGRDLKGHIVLFDARGPQSLAHAMVLADAEPSVKLVAFSVEEGENDVVACLKVGVAGYVANDASVSQLIAILRDVAQGDWRPRPGMAASLLEAVAHLARHRPKLTLRESEIARLVENGLSNGEIADRLAISVSTVKNHVHNLLQKMQVHRRAKVRAALRGWARDVQIRSETSFRSR